MTTVDARSIIIDVSAGYIPQRKYQLGNRYRVESEACLIGTKAAYERARGKTREMQQIIGGYPKTQDLNSGTVVKHFLDYHRAYHPTEGSKRGKKKARSRERSIDA